MRYLVLNEHGYVENIIMWDGVSRLPKSIKNVMLESEAPTGVTFGWQLVNDEWIPVPVVEETEQEI